MQTQIPNHILKAGVKYSCAIASRTLDLVEKNLHIGMTTDEIDEMCIEYIRSQNAESCIGYKGYPKHTCVSVNEVICHGVPSQRKLEDGDLVNVDIVVKYDGFYGDTARTFCLGNVSERMKTLCAVTRNARDIGISVVKPGIMTGDIGFAIQSYVEKSGFKLVKAFAGHGIGRQLHTDPAIKSYGQPRQGQKIHEGMIFTVEPILCGGDPAFTELSDNWTIVTQDNSWAAQWEHTLYVTHDGYELLSW